jgi:hypothetical protein
MENPYRAANDSSDQAAAMVKWKCFLPCDKLASFSLYFVNWAQTFSVDDRTLESLLLALSHKTIRLDFV